jgi:uncharacterized protein
MDRNTLLGQVKQTIAEVEPKAEIILYGSRARGDSTLESDWDFLILVDGPIDDKRVDRIRHSLYELEWQSGQVICSIVRERQQWNSQPYADTPFHRNVELEGVVI